MFKDREAAARQLAEKLKEELSPEKLKKALVLAIPRGGVMIGSVIRKALNLPLDCLITKKIPCPGNEELAIGAVGEGGVVIWEEELCRRLNVSPEYKQEIIKRKVAELEKKRQDFKAGRSAVPIAGKVAIIVDDGVATGATMKAAMAVLRSLKPEEIIVAVPVISQDALVEIKGKADKIIFLQSPEMFFSIGQFYGNFEQIRDEKVREILKA